LSRSVFVYHDMLAALFAVERNVHDWPPLGFLSDGTKRGANSTHPRQRHREAPMQRSESSRALAGAYSTRFLCIENSRFSDETVAVATQNCCLGVVLDQSLVSSTLRTSVFRCPGRGKIFGAIAFLAFSFSPPQARLRRGRGETKLRPWLRRGTRSGASQGLSSLNHHLRQFQHACIIP
jgi:hypothetical protein